SRCEIGVFSYNFHSCNKQSRKSGREWQSQTSAKTQIVRPLVRRNTRPRNLKPHARGVKPNAPYTNSGEAVTRFELLSSRASTRLILGWFLDARLSLVLRNQCHLFGPIPVCALVSIVRNV